jgi:hypothetical protein
MVESKAKRNTGIVVIAWTFVIGIVFVLCCYVKWCEAKGMGTHGKISVSDSFKPQRGQPVDDFVKKGIDPPAAKIPSR